jgi:hypothetical protein
MNVPHQTQSLKELVNKFLETSPFQRQLTTAMVSSVWQKAMPKTVCDRTEKIYIHNEKLFLKITSAALRHELQFSKDKILSLLKEAMPKALLQDVVFL